VTLAGRTILVTRPQGEAVSLTRSLKERGAIALLAPAVRILNAPTGELDQAMAELTEGRYAWLILTSRAGVDAVFDRLAANGSDAGSIPARIAAVGAGTARALEARGVSPDLVPETFTTEALGEAMPEGSGRALLARADIAPEGLEATLEAKGWSTRRVSAYRTELIDALPTPAERALLDGRVDAVTFTSASTVRGFLGMAADVWSRLAARPSVVCIGPVTAGEAERGGLVVDAVADPHTIEGLVVALERVLGRPTD
jgi:uroporphyrinogen-III synthase